MAIFKKAYSGITSDTTKHIQLDAGAFFKNFIVGTDDYASAKAAGKCLGATQGGGTFEAKATQRTISVDGAVGRVKGLTDISTWDVSMSATLLETTVETLKLALGCATATKTGEDSVAGYTKITGNSGIAEDDYIDNITWVGHIAGSAKPIIIQLKNALNEDGLSFAVQPQSEGKIGITFWAYNDLADYESDTVNPPFDIYYPDIDD